MSWMQVPDEVPVRPSAWSRALPVVMGLLVLVVPVGLARRHGPAAVAGVVVVGGLLVALVLRRFHTTVARFADTVGRAAGAAVSALLFTALALVLLPTSWLLHHAIGSDALGEPGRWSRLQRRSVAPSSPWGPDRHEAPRQVGPLVRGSALAVALVVVVVAAVPSWRDAALAPWRRSTDAVASPFAPSTAVPLGDDVPVLREPVPPGVEQSVPDPYNRRAALEGDEDWFSSKEYGSAQGYVFDPRIGWRPVSPYRMLDFTSPYLGIEQGSRRTWQPPECACRRLTVWMYGGSTTWGLDQRDDHTIASELARAAHEAGYTLDVVNNGEHGSLHWLEAERFAWDLTYRQPPDLVLFYDGVNDWWAASKLHGISDDDLDEPIDPTSIDLWDSTGRSDGPVPAAPDGASIDLDPGESRMVQQAEATIDRYDAARGMSRASADAHDVVVRYAWQPSRYTRPLVLAEEHGDTDGENYNRLAAQIMADRLPEDVIDLTDVLDDHLEPLYTDDVHHNEAAAALIAAELFEVLRPDLDALLAEQR